jgi:Domain of unknown function (DUF6378)
MDILTERTYGDPVGNHERIAALWSVILGTEVTAHSVALCCIAMKLSRAISDPQHLDSYVDIDGYARIAALIAKEGM